eukprot:GHUV01002723.1.p1 GENE.GHUV01002723.1~~GHUV01002723.1.p1  ORF type:complete len:393 (+),score=111.51 GHUV01002723.1:299-1477(+)
MRSQLLNSSRYQGPSAAQYGTQQQCRVIQLSRLERSQSALHMAQPLRSQFLHMHTVLQHKKPASLQVVAATGNQPSDPASGQLGFLGSLYKSLRDFGLGKSSMAEGTAGLFTLVGGIVGLGLFIWAKGTALRKGRPYQATIEFPLACGITVGTPVRIRGVAVGSVMNVKPSLDKVDVLIEVNDMNTVIPRNSVIEANQSGLIAEPLVDITPQLPLPTYKALPSDVTACEAEEAIVCSGGHIQGQQGVALDDMVYVMTRMARQMEEEGIDKFFEAAQAATAAIEEATPLLEEATQLTKEITPLLQELREGGLMNNLDHLTEAAAGAAADIQSLQKAVLTDDNVRALRSAVLTLCKTLEHVESISADVSVFSRDTGVQRNLKTLITALSRIIEE